jgi:hypothetical protein
VECVKRDVGDCFVECERVKIAELILTLVSFSIQSVRVEGQVYSYA